MTPWCCWTFATSPKEQGGTLAPGQDLDQLVEAVALRARAAGSDETTPERRELLGNSLEVCGKVVLTVCLLALGATCSFAASKSGSSASMGDSLGKCLVDIWRN